MFGRTEYSDRNLSPMQPNADVRIEGVPLLPRRSDRGKSLLNHACRRQGLVDIRVARIADAESRHLVGLAQLKDLPAAFQNGASDESKKFSE